MNESNIANITERKADKAVLSILSYFSLIIIILSLIGNTISFIIFRFNNEMKKMPSMVILSFYCVTSTISLFTWNLNHFIHPNYLFKIEEINIYTCKIFLFIQYFGLHSSALLLSFVSIDRYFTVISKPGSFLSKLPFGSIRSSILWSIFIVTLAAFLNLFLLILERNEKSINNIKIVDCYDNYFIVTWGKVHLYLNCILPFSIMFIFNCLLIKKTFRRSNNGSFNQSRNKNKSKQLSHEKKMKNLTNSLLFITFSFLFLTLPSSIAYGFFYFDIYFTSPGYVQNIFIFLDQLSFLNYASIFFNCFITNLKFRKIIMSRNLFLNKLLSSKASQTTNRSNTT
jgi:hypothetical protein